MYESKSIVHNRPRDCVLCRLVGGLGVLGAGLYVAKEALSYKKGYGRTLMFGIAAGFGGLGVARLLDLPPFDTFHKDGTEQ